MAKKNRITVKLTGRNDHLIHSQFSTFMDSVVSAISQYAKNIGVDPAQLEDWEIVSITKSSPATMVLEPFQHVMLDFAEPFAYAYEDYLRRPVDNIPEGFTQPVLASIERLYELTSNGIARAEVIADDHGPLIFEGSIESMIRFREAARLLEEKELAKPQESEEKQYDQYSTYVTLEGVLHNLHTYERQKELDAPKCILVNRVTKATTKCEFADNSQMDIAKSLVTKRVMVTGVAKYNTKGLAETIEVDYIEGFPEDLPPVSDLVPVDITGGEDPADYVDRMRR